MTPLVSPQLQPVRYPDFSGIFFFPFMDPVLANFVKNWVKIPVFPGKNPVFSGNFRISPRLQLRNTKRRHHPKFQLSTSKNGSSAHLVRELYILPPPPYFKSEPESNLVSELYVLPNPPLNLQIIERTCEVMGNFTFMD